MDHPCYKKRTGIPNQLHTQDTSVLLARDYRE